MSTNRARFSIPLRIKIVGLVVAMLVVSLAAYVYIGTSLIVNDKTSYIYDLTLTQVRLTAVSVQTKVDNAAAFSTSLASIALRSGSSGPDETNRTVEPFFKAAASDLNVLHTSVFEVSGKDADTTIHLLARGGEDTEAFSQATVSLASKVAELPIDKRPTKAVGTVVAGALPIYGEVRAGHRSAIYVTLIAWDKTLLDSQRGGLDVTVQAFDQTGNVLVEEGRTPPPGIEKLYDKFRSGQFVSGAQDWVFDKSTYIVGYHRLFGNGLTVIGYSDKGLAFLASKLLAWRSLFLGVSILFLAVGLSLIVVRTITSKLNLIWQATKRIAVGDFTVRVATSAMGNDEVGALGQSFNVMADKIDELMEKTAQKARMESELQTARLVQKSFFPTEDFISPTVEVAGYFLPASECGGDWWHHLRVGDHLIVAVGDVTGHGVSAALVTAAAYGAFTTLSHELMKNPDHKPSIAWIIERLNLAVHQSGRGESSMTMVAGLIDLRTRSMTFVNASHRPPLHCQLEGDQINVKPLMIETSPALGLAPTIDVNVSTVELSPGSRVVWYTDGLVECANADGKALGSKGLQRILQNTVAATLDSAGSARELCDIVVNETNDYFGTAIEHREDDITLVTTSIH